MLFNPQSFQGSYLTNWLKYIPLLVPLAFSLFSPKQILASFGQNKVQYRYFHWQYLTTEHFDIYYNQGGREVADYAAEVAEDAYRQISGRFKYSGSTDTPIILVTYQSHNDFEQTNVSSGAPEESVGGFTEFLRTRVVVPFEGDHERFRHVIHHELTHAMMLNLLYGQGFGAVLAGVSQTRVPLWFTEGLAEYESRGGLDSETEMYLRDAVVNDLLPEINQLNEMGYLGVYKSGQSILYYIAYRYGDEKIGEILHQLKGLKDFDRALTASIGIDEEELSKRWRRFMKERYWGQVAKLDPPSKWSMQLTDHKKEYCYINNSPALSPNGEYLAFLSDRSDFFDVYLMRTLDGKVVRRLVHGQRTGQFEELHWLRPGITWSPDGKQIALAAKAGAYDAIYILSVDDGEIVKKIVRESDGMFSPSWSPDGERLAFVFVQDGRSDLAVYNLTSDSFELITNDLFDDADPSWAPDSRSLLFTSNRADLPKEADLPDGRTMKGHAVASFDVFQIELDTKQISRITTINKIVRTPIWTPESNTILFVCNQNEIFNLYTHNTLTGVSTPLTNVVTGFLQPSFAWKTHTLAFTSYYDQGYDIFLISDLLKLSSSAFVMQLPPTEVITPVIQGDSDFGAGTSDYSEFVFDRILKDTELKEPETVDSTKIVPRSKTESGTYASHNYKVKLSPDEAFFSASYSPYFHAQGSAMIRFSDVLVNHLLDLSLDVNRSIENSNFFVQYYYLPRRMALGSGIFHVASAYQFIQRYENKENPDNIFTVGERVAYFRDRNYGFFLQSAYPLDRYNRFEYGFDFNVIDRNVFVDDSIGVLVVNDNDTTIIVGTRSYGPTNAKTSLLMPHIGYVHDTAIWHNSTAPANGSRWRLDALWSPNIGINRERVPFTTLAVDWSRYFVYKKEFTFALRLSGATSYGKSPQRFFLGGVQNWFNPRYDNSARRVQIDNLQDIYYSNFVGPLRGVGYYNQVGSRYALSNAEFRFPFIKHLVFGWPLPIYIRDLQGALFTDWGAAWQPGNRFKEGLLPEKGAFGFGFGLRIDLGIFPIEWDVAWSPDKRSNMVPQYYISINTGF